MMSPLYDKEGDVICEVCGDYWDSHGLGGNCQKLPLSPEQREVVERVYSKTQRPPKIAAIMAATAR